MQPSTLKRNLLPIALMTLGCLIFLATIFYLFRSQMEFVGWVALGLFMIAIGVLGIVVTSPKANANADADAEAAPSSQVSSEPAPPAPTSPEPPTPQAGEVTPEQRSRITLSKPVLIGGGVLLVSLVVLLLCNLVTALRPLFTVTDNKIVDCGDVALYVEDGWRFVLAYSYRATDAESGYEERTDCVVERERFVWVKNKRTPKTEDTPQPEDEATADFSNPAPDAWPTWTPYVQPPAAQMPAPSPTPWVVNSPLPTTTPPLASAPLPTNTPLSSLATATPVPSTDLEVCAATLNDTYLNTYIQWKGMIVDDPTFNDEGLWFQVSWKNPNSNSECKETVFFVSYDSDERFFAEDMVAVTGAISNINYDYENNSGQTEYAVVVKADDVEFLDEP